MLIGCAAQQSSSDQLLAEPTALNYLGEISGNFGGKTLDAPEDVAVDPAGNIYIADTGNDRIVKLTADNRYVTSSGGFGVGSGFNRPIDIVTADGIDFYVLDQGNRRIVRLDYNLIAGDDLGFAEQSDLLSIGQATAMGVAVDGLIYVLDPDNLRVLVLNTDYTVERELTTSGGFVGCSAIALDRSRRAYIYDNQQQAIFAFDAFGNHSGRIDLDQVGELGGLARREQYFIATDLQRNELMVIDGTGRQIVTVGRQGEGAYHFDNPRGIAVRPDGRIYVADTGNDRIVYYELAAE